MATATNGLGPAKTKIRQSPNTFRQRFPYQLKRVSLVDFPSLAILQHTLQIEAEIQEVLDRINKMLSECDEVASALQDSPHLIPDRVIRLQEGVNRMMELFGDNKTAADTNRAASSSPDSNDENKFPRLVARFSILKDLIDEFEKDKMPATPACVPELADEAKEFFEKKGGFWNESWDSLCHTEDGAHAIRCISARGKDQEQYGTVYGKSWEFAFDPRLNGDFQQEWYIFTPIPSLASHYIASNIADSFDYCRHSPHAEPEGRWRKVPDYSEYREAQRVLEETGEQIEFTLPIPFLEPEDPIEPTELVSVDPGKKSLRALVLAGKRETLNRVLMTPTCKEKTEPETFERYCRAMMNLE